MDQKALKQLFRAHVERAAGCPIRWESESDFAGPDGAVSPAAVGYLRRTSGRILGTFNEERYEGDKLRVYEHNLTRDVVTVSFESADGRSNYDAYFYARKAEAALRRRDVSYPANVENFDVYPTQLREGPTIEDQGETLSTAVLEVVWHAEQITASLDNETDRVVGAGLTHRETIETLGDVGKLEDLAPDGATIALSGSCALS